MPRYSAFTRYGHLRFSSQLSYGELIYKALYNSLGGNYSNEIGSRAEARIYATAMALARARGQVEKGSNQTDPRRVTDLLPVREQTYGLIPGLHDSIFDRQDALIAKRLLPQGARYTAVTEALDNAIGDDFLFYWVLTNPVDIATYPNTTLGPCNWILPGQEIRVVRLTGAVSITGSPVSVGYAPIDPDDLSRIEVGDVLIMSTNNIGLAEKVTVTAASPTAFVATFTSAHDPGDICTTAPFPYWITNKQYVFVIITPEAQLDSEKRRKVNQVMKQIMRTWVRWGIVPDDGTGTGTATFTVEDPILGRIGYAGIGSIPYP